MKNALRAWPALQKRIGPDRPLLIFLDFDGTPPALASYPSLIRVKKKGRSQAAYCVDSPAGVVEWLRQIWRLRAR